MNLTLTVLCKHSSLEFVIFVSNFFMISITFPDGKSESFKSGVTSYEVALSISEVLQEIY